MARINIPIRESGFRNNRAQNHDLQVWITKDGRRILSHINEKDKHSNLSIIMGSERDKL